MNTPVQSSGQMNIMRHQRVDISLSLAVVAA